MTDSRRLAALARRFGATLVGVSVGIGAGQGWAYWTAREAIPSVTLRAGQLDVTATWLTTALSGTGLQPGSRVSRMFTVSNAGTAPLQYGLAVTRSGLAAHIDVIVVAGATSDATNCTGGSAPLSLTAAPVDVGILAAGASQALCVRATLSASAPSAAQGSSGSLTLSVAGRQIGAPP